MSLQFEQITISAGENTIVSGVSFELKQGEVSLLMGPNGSGKSTLVNGVLGHPKFQIKEGRLLLDGVDITHLKTDKKAALGIFLSQQYLPEIPGVTLNNFLYKAYKQIKGVDQLSILDFYKMAEARAKEIGMSGAFLKRQVGSGLSGGEKKQSEMLQAIVLEPRFVILDEIDSGVDVDAMEIIIAAIGWLKEKGVGILVITHYDTIVSRINPDYVHVMKDGKLIRSGGIELTEQIRLQGFQNIT